MDYHELGWGELRSFAKSQDIDTKGLKRIEILEALDSFNSELTIDEQWEDVVTYLTDSEKEITEAIIAKRLKPFKGIKETHPLFKEIEPYLPHLKAYAKLKAVSNVEGISEGIAVLFMKHIEEDKRAPINLGCGPCRDRYYKRMIQGYNKLAEEYGEPRI